MLCALVQQHPENNFHYLRDLAQIPERRPRPRNKLVQTKPSFVTGPVGSTDGGRYKYYVEVQVSFSVVEKSCKSPHLRISLKQHDHENLKISILLSTYAETQFLLLFVKEYRMK